jgi:hypothetical protein
LAITICKTSLKAKIQAKHEKPGLEEVSRPRSRLNIADGGFKS